MDLEEFTKLLSDWIHGRIKIDHTLMGGSKEEFDRYDLNHDGVLDTREMALRAVAKAQTLDKNHDGVVTKAEFTVNAEPADPTKA
jgi:Ca2+-binding EF-hand superfamily protein